MQNSSGNISSHMLVCSKFHLEIAKASHNSIILSVMYHLSGGMKATLWENIEKKILIGKKRFHTTLSRAYGYT